MLKFGANATPQFIGALTEMIWAQIGKYGRCWDTGDCGGLTHWAENISQDLESFSKYVFQARNLAVVAH